MLLPITFGLGDPVSSLIMLAGIYYGAQYGGSTTAILINMPGESSSVVTAIDGYQMARQGRAGAALAIAAHRLVLRRHGRDAARRAVRAAADGDGAASSAPAEYFSLMVARASSAPSRWRTARSLKAMAMVVLGLLLGLVGTDVNSRRAALHASACRELADGHRASSPSPSACSASPRSCATSRHERRRARSSPPRSRA